MNSGSPNSTAEKSIADYQVGDSASFEVDIDKALIDRFAEVSGDHNPLHMDEEYGAATSFGGRIAHGMICGALFSRLVGEHLPGERALYRSQELKFIRPIRPGTRVCVSAEVLAIDPTLNLLTLATKVCDALTQEDLVTGEAEVVIREDIPCEEAPLESTASGALHQRNILVLGGSAGIGRTISKNLAAAGANLIISYCSSESRAKKVQQELKGTTGSIQRVHCDLRTVDSEMELLSSISQLDGIVFCGFGEIDQRGITRGDVKELGDSFQRSVMSTYSIVQQALPKLSKGASIVTLASTVTLEPPPPHWTAYTVAKCALVGLVRSLAVELGPRSIRVNAISPSMVLTAKTQGLPPRILDEFAGRSPLSRLATPEDVAKAVRFLLSEESSFLTGLNLPVAGGGVML